MPIAKAIEKYEGGSKTNTHLIGSRRVECDFRRGLSRCSLIKRDVVVQFLLLGGLLRGGVLALSFLNLKGQNRSRQLEDLVLDLAVLISHASFFNFRYKHRGIGHIPGARSSRRRSRP